MTGREPSQITLNVCAARNLQSKKKEETCKASVVFGIGKQQFVTEVVESNSPEWSQEAIIKLSPKDLNQTIKFKVRDGNHVLGVVRLTVSNLRGERDSRPRWEPLVPYKKAGEVFGELQIECFVSAYRPGQIVSNSEKSSPLQSRFGSQEDILDIPKKGRFSFHRRTHSGSKQQVPPESTGGIMDEGGVSGNESSRTSSAVYPSHGLSDAGDLLENKVQSVRNVPLGHSYVAPHTLTSPTSETPIVSVSRGASPTPTTSEMLTCPQVTGVSPKEGPMEGGQKVVLRGSNLGESREDILKVVVADVDCTGSLEYSSPSKLSIITSPRFSPGVGPVKVETQSGGLGVSSVNFAFVEKEVASPPEVSGISPSEGSVEGGQRVVLRGNNLGECKEDVVKVVLAGVDCTETLEFFSPAKLAVTTLPRPSASEGAVVVETSRGGVTQSNMVFSFVEKVISISSHSKTLEAAKKQQEERHQVEVKGLKSQIKDLKDENIKLKERNHALRDYIDQLLLAVIDVSPNLLEVKPSSSLSLHSSPSLHHGVMSSSS